MSHVDAAHKYARDIVAGKIPACEWTRLACQRQLDDLKRWPGKKGPYWFDKQAAEKVCELVALLPHVKGKWAKGDGLTPLEPWSAFSLAVPFGWKTREGFRRFRTIYETMGRKNGKSTKAAGVGLYMLGFDDEPGAEVYSAATTRDQAKIVFDTAKRMAERSPDLRNACGLKVYEHSMFIPESGSKFQPLSAEGNSLDGLNSHCNINDELHAQKSRAVYDALETATGSRDQPMNLIITTRGVNVAGIGYEIDAYARRVLSKVIEDETFFALIYALDPDDDWQDPKNWIKANPNLGVSLYQSQLERLCVKAKASSASAANFRTKHLNEWVGAGNAWVDIAKWQACEDSIALDDFAGKPCFIGLDLAYKIDIAAMVMLFPDGDGYALFGKYYLPEATVSEHAGRHMHYESWADDGYFTVTPGQITDFGIIKEDIIDLSKMFDVRGIAYDPWQATHLASELMAEGAPMIEYRNTVANMSEPMKTFEALILSEQLRHDGNPAMDWMMSNVVAWPDRKDNIMPRKETPDSKIDGPVATIMALGLAISNDHQADESYTATHGVVMLA